MDCYLGPYCQEIQLTNSQVNDVQTIKPLCNQEIHNGILVELYKHFNNISSVVNVITALNPAFASLTVTTLRSQISRVLDIKKKLVSKKKVKGISSVNDLLQQVFKAPSFNTENPSHREFENSLPVHVVENLSPSNEIIIKENSDVLVTPPRKSTKSLETINEETVQSSPREHDSELSAVSLSKDEAKVLNQYEYELRKKTLKLKKLNNLIHTTEDRLKTLESRIGHFAVRNVNKRDETARTNLHRLRECQRQNRKLLAEKELAGESIRKLTEENKNLRSGPRDEQTDFIIKNLEQKKLLAQKSASYYKVRATKLTAKLKNRSNESEITSLKNQIKVKDTKIRELEMNCDILKEQVDCNSCSTKNPDGTFTDNLRLCVVELSGLEVAVEKVASVIETVSRHLFNTDLRKCDLPSSTTVQSIVDEGHYLAKTFISEQLADSENWGISRDGTTRRKQKILDTSITLSTGDVLSLGFNRVAHETAVTINDVTKGHIDELAAMNLSCVDTDHYIRESLEKLSVTMSDRASNEKKADRLLDEWRDEILENTPEDQKQEVLHFHCMAHVLLGFHRYITMDIKSHETTIKSEHGELGRDVLSVFKFWRTKGTVVERTVRMVSEVFGPSGDHHGVRDIWEAHCAANGIKSVIGNYKDNRFNALFQTAAEIFLHREDFIQVLKTVKSPNLKLRSVLADLQSDIIMTMIHCLGLFYVKITGPYWNLVTGNQVPYLELFSEIRLLSTFLQQCEKDPAVIYELNSHLSSEDPYQILQVPYRCQLSEKLSVLPNDKLQELLCNTVILVSKAMTRTITTQLKDFLPDGQFSLQPSKSDLGRTSFAHATNLGCEHHFGDLDSSQRRRPSASMHHHSSVQLLKRNRKPIMKWLGNMSLTQRSDLLHKARREGKLLRVKHLEQERSVLRDIHHEIVNETKKRKVNQSKRITKKSRSEENDSYVDNDDETLSDDEMLQCDTEVSVNSYVAIAYQDNWYPGIVVTEEDNKFVVNFMVPARKFGHFSWPAREDKQTVEKQFVIYSGFIPNCVNSGRMWHILETEKISEIYKRFSRVYFE